jgi:hypothetical protein
LPGGAGDQIEELIDPVVAAFAAGNQVKNALPEQAKAEHFDRGPQGAYQE